MYAIIKSGGKQRQVSAGDVVRLEQVSAEAGATIELPVLMVGGEDIKTRIGTPLVEGVRVEAEVLGHELGPKLRVSKFKRRKKYRRVLGHRQCGTEVRITAIHT